MKADGYNAVTVYFDWDYTSPAPGVYDFSGVRDMNLFLNMAQQAGLYVIARPGPYINAETDARRDPGLGAHRTRRLPQRRQPYQSAELQWLSEIDSIIAPHQVTNGGDVIAYQIENEYTGRAPPTCSTWPTWSSRPLRRDQRPVHVQPVLRRHRSTPAGPAR